MSKRFTTFKNNDKFAELIGIIIGDGNIYYNLKLKKYYFEITGDMTLDKTYFNHISNLVSNLFDKKPSINIRSGGLRLRFYSKDFVSFLINTINLPYGKDKGIHIKIPDYITTQGWNIVKSCIRGITDTDGCLFLSKKTHRIDYPSIEISTTSMQLAFQLRYILSNHYRLGFRSYSRKNFRELYVISINGEEMVNKWVTEIGFSNKRKLKKWVRGDLNSRQPRF